MPAARERTLGKIAAYNIKGYFVKQMEFTFRYGGQTTRFSYEQH
jgi:hypothetical protein